MEVHQQNMNMKNKATILGRYWIESRTICFIENIYLEK